tara:strand:- start:798 stop:1184 length:387 start_codon:yes stop_codon:yes gene_type:complete
MIMSNKKSIYKVILYIEMSQSDILILIVPIFLLFIFLFLFLPSQCENTTYYMHDHCHQMRNIGINCMPGDNCWYHYHNTPGPYGFVLILFAFGAIAFCVFWTPSENHVAPSPTKKDYTPRKKRRFDNV